MWLMIVPKWQPAKLNNLINCHWAERARMKRDDANIVGYYFRSSGIPKAERRRRVGMNITLAPRQRAGDPDAYWKSTLDALVKCGALKDDSRTWCELGTVEFDRGSEACTVIVLEDI